MAARRLDAGLGARTLALAVCAALACGQALAASEIVDQANGFAATPPDGWTVQRDPGQGVQLFFRSPDKVASCSTTSRPIPQLVGVPQSEIDANLLAGQGDDMLRRNLERDGFTYRNLTNGVVDIRGRKVLLGEADVTREGLDAHTLTLVALAPGRLVAMECFIDKGFVERYRAKVNDILRSLRLT